MYRFKTIEHPGYCVCLPVCSTWPSAVKSGPRSLDGVIGFTYSLTSSSSLKSVDENNWLWGMTHGLPLIQNYFDAHRTDVDSVTEEPQYWGTSNVCQLCYTTMIVADVRAQICIRPSTTTMLTWLWSLNCHMNHIKQPTLCRGFFSTSWPWMM